MRKGPSTRDRPSLRVSRRGEKWLPAFSEGWMTTERRREMKRRRQRRRKRNKERVLEAQSAKAKARARAARAAKKADSAAGGDEATT